MNCEPGPLVLRRADPADWPSINTLDTRSFGLPAPLPAAELAEFRAKVDEAIVVCDTGSADSPVVAVSLWHTLPLTVPGGTTVPSAGLSWVSVAATHRRQGLLRMMMAEQFAAWQAAGLPLAILTASEGGIYERFGFGPACFAQRVTLAPSAARWRSAAPESPRVRYGTPSQVAELVPSIHRRWASTVPGAVGRPDSWWPTILADRDFRRNTQTSGRYYLLHDDGYAAYRIDARTATALVEEVCAVTDQAHADLWRVLTGLDLVQTLSAKLAVDDPLPHRLHDARAVQVTGRSDELWLTILDVPAALAARDFAADGTIALQVSDEWGDRAGWYLVEVAGRRARVRPSTAPECAARPRVALSVPVLSSLYTGGVTARELAAAGRLTADSPATLTTLDALLGGHRAPFAGTYF